MEHVLDVYKRPYEESNPVVCMDESSKQLIVEGRKSLSMKPGFEKREDYEYVRHGVVNIFMANEPLAGKRAVEVTDTNSPSSLYATFTPEEAKRIRDRFEFVFTPRHGSWLNMVEVELYVLNGQCLNRHIATMNKVKSEIEACQNNKDAKINLQFTKEDAGIKLKRLYPTINT